MFTAAFLLMRFWGAREGGESSVLCILLINAHKQECAISRRRHTQGYKNTRRYVDIRGRRERKEEKGNLVKQSDLTMLRAEC